MSKREDSNLQPLAPKASYLTIDILLEIKEEIELSISFYALTN